MFTRLHSCSCAALLNAEGSQLPLFELTFTQDMRVQLSLHQMNAFTLLSIDWYHCTYAVDVIMLV